MDPKTIPDDELLQHADQVTIWVASVKAPRDIWSLREAIAWVNASPEAGKIGLHRPAREGVRAAWLKPDQIERLSAALCESVAA